jgi:hypothetical protein
MGAVLSAEDVETLYTKLFSVEETGIELMRALIVSE